MSHSHLTANIVRPTSHQSLSLVYEGVYVCGLGVCGEWLCGWLGQFDTVKEGGRREGEGKEETRWAHMASGKPAYQPRR
jgi:hypothetical protein